MRGDCLAEEEEEEAKSWQRGNADCAGLTMLCSVLVAQSTQC